MATFRENMIPPNLAQLSPINILPDYFKKRKNLKQQWKLDSCSRNSCSIFFVSQGDCQVSFSSAQLLSCVRLFATPWTDSWRAHGPTPCNPMDLLFATPWTIACQAFQSITISCSLPKPKSIKSMMDSNHLILCYHPLFLPSIFPSIRVFSNESVLGIRWSKY